MRELKQIEIEQVNGGLLGIVGIPSVIGAAVNIARIGGGIIGFPYRGLPRITMMARGIIGAAISGAGILVSLLVPIL